MNEPFRDDVDQVQPPRSQLVGLVKGLVLLISLVAIGFAVKWSGLISLLDEAWIDDWVRGRGAVGEVVFLAIGAAATAIGTPRQLISFLAGYAFGLLEGSGLALLATVLGCMTSFTYARLLGREAIVARASPRLRRIDAFLCRSPFVMALLIRLMPLGNNLLTNLVAGVSNISAMRFFAGSALGFIPQTVVFALVGSGIHLDPVLRITTSVVLFLLSALLGMYLYRRYGGRRSDTVTATEQQETPS